MKLRIRYKKSSMALGIVGLFWHICFIHQRSLLKYTQSQFCLFFFRLYSYPISKPQFLKKCSCFINAQVQSQEDVVLIWTDEVKLLLLRKHIVAHGLQLVLSCLCRASQEYVVGQEEGKGRALLCEQYVKHNTNDACSVLTLENNSTSSYT